MSAPTTDPAPAATDPTGVRSADQPAWTGWMAGSVAAGVALAFGELVDGLTDGDIPGLVLAVGEWFVDITPGDLVAEGIENAGTNQKVILLGGITVVALLVGAALGRASQTVSRWVGPIGFAAFGVLGGFATARNPLSPAVASWFWSLIAAALGIATLWFLLGRLNRPTRFHTAMEDPRDPKATRRAFLGWSAGAGAVAVTGFGLSNRVQGTSAAEVARSSIELAPSASPPADALAATRTLDTVEGITPYVTPTERFYRIDTALRIPQVDPAGWSLRINGMVDEEVEFTYDDLAAMDQVEKVVTLSCVSNEIGGNLAGTAVWTGIPLVDLLDRAGVADGATQIVGRSVDDWTAGFPTAALTDGRTALLALGMNGEPLPTRHGFPARLVIAGLYGYVSAVEWIEEITLTTWEDFDGLWVPRGWSKEGPMKTTSRIDVPASGTEVPAGPTAIAGVAWSPNRGIDAVQVSIDGSDWIDCELGESIGPETWVQWKTSHDAEPGLHNVMVRAIDGDGTVQSSGPVPPRPDGAEGWHSRAFRAV